MIAKGCNTHKTGAKACPTCHRISIEAEIVTRTVDALIAAGYRLNVDNGGDQFELPDFTTDREAVLKVLMDTDVDYLFTRAADDREGWVLFVYGNEGWTVISDYTTSLEAALESVNQYADELGNGVQE